MKRLFLIVVFFFLCIPPFAYAHLAGQAPFFEVNGIYSSFYPVPTTSLTNFPLAQDAGPQLYLVNQPISFLLDTSKLPVPPEIIKVSKFTWDFGDGKKATGLTNTHIYTHIGSHMLSIYVDDGENPTPQLLESVLLQIVPNTNYHLPKAVLTIDGLTKPNALNNEFHIPMHQTVTLNASASIAPSSTIATYFWDVGDGNSQPGQTITYTYPGDERLVFVVLRVTDTNGFIADTYTAIRNDIGIVLPTAAPKHHSILSSGVFFFLAGVVILVVSTVLIVFFTGYLRSNYKSG